MEYRSVAHLNADIKDWAVDLPRDIDLIVGVPRSGLLVSNLLALHLNIAMTDVEGLINGDLIQSGDRHTGKQKMSEVDKALVVDDVVDSGGTLKEVKREIQSAKPSIKIDYGAPYVSPASTELVDTYAETLSSPQVFEWNIMHHSNLKDWCVDLDGILCRDPTPNEDDDGEQYTAFINSVEPRIIPTKKIGSIVTARLEKYREQTERWLTKHDIEYDELIMRSNPSIDHAVFKSEIYKNKDSPLFIESGEDQSRKIVKSTKKPVYCPTTNIMYQPGYAFQIINRANESMETVRSEPMGYVAEFVSDPADFTRRAISYTFR